MGWGATHMGRAVPIWGEQLLTWPSHNKRILWKRWKISSLGWWMVSIISLPDSATTFKCCSSSREEDASRPTKSTLKVISRKGGCWGWFSCFSTLCLGAWLSVRFWRCTFAGQKRCSAERGPTKGGLRASPRKILTLGSFPAFSVGNFQ